MSVMLDYWTRLDQRPSGSNYRLPYQLGPNFNHFKQAGWISLAGYLAAIGDEFDLSEEVDVEDIDEDAGIFRHIDPQHRWRKIEKPLSSITLYEFRENTWLDELANLLAFEPRQASNNRVLVPQHLWHLGQLRIQGTRKFAPVFITRLATKATSSKLNAALADPIWQRGIVLHINSSAQLSVGEHVFRQLGDFLYAENGQEQFDLDALDRILRGFVTPIKESEPEQFISSTRLKLPHFKESREYSTERMKVIKALWGIEGSPAPSMSWADANREANTGYQSFDDAFDTVKAREDVIEKVSRGKYRVRRNP